MVMTGQLVLGAETELGKVVGSSRSLPCSGHLCRACGVSTRDPTSPLERSVTWYDSWGPLFLIWAIDPGVEGALGSHPSCCLSH